MEGSTKATFEVPEEPGFKGVESPKLLSEDCVL